jgi:hypothetical protein
MYRNAAIFCIVDPRSEKPPNCLRIHRIKSRFPTTATTPSELGPPHVLVIVLANDEAKHTWSVAQSPRSHPRYGRRSQKRTPVGAYCALFVLFPPTSKTRRRVWTPVARVALAMRFLTPLAVSLSFLSFASAQDFEAANIQKEKLGYQVRI